MAHAAVRIWRSHIARLGHHGTRVPDTRFGRLGGVRLSIEAGVRPGPGGPIHPNRFSGLQLDEELGEGEGLNDATVLVEDKQARRALKRPRSHVANPNPYGVALLELTAVRLDGNRLDGLQGRHSVGLDRPNQAKGHDDHQHDQDRDEASGGCHGFHQPLVRAPFPF